jgi:cell division protein FtsB
LREARCMPLRPTRLLALGGIVVAGLFYWKPLNSYLHTREVLNRRQAEVAKLEQQKHQLEQRIATVGQGDALIREARRLGLVKPGERLYIVRGVSTWRAKH